MALARNQFPNCPAYSYSIHKAQEKKLIFIKELFQRGKWLRAIKNHIKELLFYFIFKKMSLKLCL